MGALARQRVKAVLILDYTDVPWGRSGITTVTAREACDTELLKAALTLCVGNKVQWAARITSARVGDALRVAD